MRHFLASIALLAVFGLENVASFQLQPGCERRCTVGARQSSFLLSAMKNEDTLPREPPGIVKNEENEQEAATNTINERLMAELQEAADKEKFGARSKAGKKLGLSSFRPERTEEQRLAAIEEARNLNGVNPLVALGGGSAALAMAGALWLATNWLAEFFVLHPVETDVYFIQRVTQVFRNVVMGLASLASGFFGVTGVGVFALGIRVAYGVAKGELDPTPIKKKPGEEIELPNVWDLMMNKKPSRRGGSKDNNPFGI
jgi:hypothetical protein